MVKRKSTKIVSMLLAVVMILGALPMSAFAAPNSDIPSDMLDNKYLDALAYTGYDVQAQKNDGSIFVTYGSRVSASIRSNITYDTGPSGLETVTKSGTATGKAPDIAKYESSGLCCASYVSYVYYNYLPNIAGVDTSTSPCPSNPRSANAYNEQANSWIANGTARRISFTQASNGDNFNPSEEIPIGSLIVFEHMETGRIAHVALYAGYYNGNHFVTHVGNERGPEFSTIVGMSKGGYPEAVVQVVVPDFVEENGAIEVHKKDTDGKNLSGAVFVATNKDTGKQYKIGPTNSKGYAITSEGIPYGTYSVKETVFPTNYRSYGKTEWTVTVSSSNNGVVSFDAVNEIIPGSVKIIKTSEDGKVDGISFTISGNGVNKTVTTNSKGEVQVDELKPGTYTVTEKAYDKYEPQEVRTVNVVTGKVSSVAFSNVLKRGDLQVIKSSEDNFVKGMTFHLYGTSLSGIKVDEYATTNANGIAYFDDVLIGTGYTIEEVDTPVRYVIPEKQTTSIAWDEISKAEFRNILKKWQADVFKLDSELAGGGSGGAVPVSELSMTFSLYSDEAVEELGSPYGDTQGNATLAGAVYGVYKGEELVDTYTTDANGYFLTKYYPCGDDWTIREITPSEGYLLDPTVYYLDTSAENFTVELNTIYPDVYEEIIKGDIAIIKHTDDGSTQIETPEAGAEFEIYLKSSGSFAEAEETERDVIVCDENGFGQTKMLPYGIYTVHQVSGWEGRELMSDFDVFISQDGQTYRYIINNRNFESFVNVVKVDAESGKTIPYAGAGFKIYDPDGNQVTMTFTYPTPTTIDTFFTDANGSLVTPEKLDYGKGYSIVEVQAPYGYVLDETPVYFDITEENSTEENGVTVIKVDKPNMAQKGTITVEKTGEVFYGVNVSGSEDTDVIYQPIYEIAGLEGAVYEIRAAEDIYTPDGTLRYSKGEVVDTITTTFDGFVTSKKLYLGKYEVQEIEAPYGMVLNDEVHNVELTYAGQNVAVTETSTSFYNERQKVEISLEKSLEINELFGIGNNGEIKNISFGLFAAEDIVSVSGTVIPADGLIEIVSPDENGKAVMTSDLPFGKYYVKELLTDEHYKLNDTKYPVEFAYAGQDTSIAKIAVNNGEKIENELIYGSVSGIKKDENGEALSGAVIGLFASSDTEFTKDNALMTTISAEDGSFSFANIPYGTWCVREIEQPTGFVLNENVFDIVISQDKEVVEVEIINEFVRGNITLTKVDEEYPDNKLTGAEFEVYKDINENGEIDEADELMGNLEEVEIGIYEMTDLLYGKYLVCEVKAPEGFLLDEGVYTVFIETDGTTYSVENKAGVGFINAAMKGNLKIVKTSSDGKVEGFSFRVTGANGYDMTFETDENGEILIEGLRIGTYTVSEVANSVSAAYVMPADKNANVILDSTTIVEMHNEYRDTPKTGDESNLGLWFALAGLSAIGIAVTSVVAYKKRKKEDNE